MKAILMKTKDLLLSYYLNEISGNLLHYINNRKKIKNLRKN